MKYFIVCAAALAALAGCALQSSPVATVDLARLLDRLKASSGYG